MAKATITAASKKFTKGEGETATAIFNFSQALDNSADVVVRLTGIGAQKDKDFGELKYVVKNAGGSVVKTGTFTKNTGTINTGTINLPKDSKSLELSSDIKADLIAGEQNESLVFSVQQAPSASKVLENSYYVTSTATIKETLSLAKISVDTKWYNDRVNANQTTINNAINTTFKNNLEYTVSDASEKFTFQESAPTATLTEDANGVATASTYKYAIGAFKLSTPLDEKAVISVQVEGQGADLAEDTVGSLQALVTYTEKFGNGTTTQHVDKAIAITNGRLELPDGTTSFKLGVALKGDNITEQQAEKLNFKVAQVSGNLKDSYYVNVETEVVDREVAATADTTFTLASAETKTGTDGQDIFNLYTVTYDNNGNANPPTNNANSTPFANTHDLIAKFGTGDVIKLSDTVQRYSIGEVTLKDFTDGGTGAADLFKTLEDVKYDENFPNGTGSILKIVENDTTVWLLIDTNANGIMDTRGRGNGSAGGMNDKYDTLIKVTGTAPSGQTLTDLITGESFITE